MPLQPGQVINNRYRVVRLLGQGGFGAVYRAYDLTLKNACAVKENLEISASSQHQFQQEAIILAGLRHSNLPRVYDHFLIPDQGQYLVMDYVEGEDLQKILDRTLQPLPEVQAIAWIAQVCDALSYLHRQNPAVIHRDIKPANIKITPEGQAMLVDFGIAKVYNPNQKTTAGARAVTPGYSPPEQYGQGTTDGRTDIYALGSTLYTLLTNELPLESVRRMTGDSLLPVQQINPLVSTQVAQALARAMALNPAQRFQTAAEFKAALTAPAPAVMVAQQPPAYAYARQEPTVVVPQSQIPYPSVPARPVQAPPKSRPASSGSRVLVGVGVGVLVAICLGIIALGGLIYLMPDSTSTPGRAATQTREAEIRMTETSLQETATALAMSILPTPFPPGDTPEPPPTNEGQPYQPNTGAEVVFGPQSGSLDYSKDTISGYRTNVSLADFILEVTFTNPYAAAEGKWDYGFLLRHEDFNRHYRLVLFSDKSWKLLNNTGSPEGEVVSEGSADNLNTDANGANTIRLVVKGNTGELYINGALVSNLDMSKRTNPGDIFVAYGIFQNDSQQGKLVNFENLTIWTNP
jgi:serine/threonine protein kinase